MFGDPVNNTMSWEVKKLKDISIKIMSGNTPKGGEQVYVEEGIMFFRSQNVWKNKLLLDDVAYIDKQTHNKMKKSSLKNRDILMTKTGRINTENSSLGRAAMFLGEDDSANVNGHVYLIRLQEGIINEFILYILTSKEYRGYIRTVCVGGIDKRQLNKEHIEEFPIIFPPIEKQKKFVSYVKQVDKLKFEMEGSLEYLEDKLNSVI
jgi:type I restriction enzyme S subunit